MPPDIEPRKNSWPNAFRCAVRGIGWGFRRQRNFAVHLTMALVVQVVAAALGVSLLEWCLLLLCVAAVLVAELFNTALEHLARAITHEQNEELRDALDTSSGAVLLAAAAAALVGCLIFAHRLGWF